MTKRRIMKLDEIRKISAYFQDTHDMNAGSGAVNYRVSLPSVWATEMNISKENPELVMTFDGNKIVITKRGENNG